MSPRRESTLTDFTAHGGLSAHCASKEKSVGQKIEKEMHTVKKINM